MLLLTPEQRIERAEELNRQSMEMLKASQDGYRAYLERNFRARRHRPENR
ncbi:hypothetical protein [Rubripirellula tenax]|nr:hypothetical protein [Rubripirellula tenax]